MPGPKEEAAFWIEELRDLSPEVRYLIWKALPDRLNPNGYERLVAEESEDDDDRWYSFTCPHCQSVNEYHELVIIDWSKRESEFVDMDIDDTNLAASYGSTEDYHGIAYECGYCNAPVSLPAGWKEV